MKHSRVPDAGGKVERFADLKSLVATGDPKGSLQKNRGTTPSFFEGFNDSNLFVFLTIVHFF